MKFSVITPVLNGAEYIDAAIQSVKSQIAENWEMLIIDGGSRDETLDIADKHAKSDRRITVTSEPDKGMYDALLKGVERTNGEWICWLNSDDLYTPWCFSTVQKWSRVTPGRWYTGFPGCWDEQGQLRYVRPVGCYSQQKIAAGWHHEKLLGYLQQESIFFTRDLLETLSPEEISRVREMRYAGDFLLWRLFARQASLEVVPSVLGGFRRHGSNMSAKQKHSYWTEVQSTKPFVLPRPLALPVSYFYRSLSVKSVWKLIETADSPSLHNKTA